MALFVVQHKHSSEMCPARSREMGEMLIEHLSAANAEKHGLLFPFTNSTFAGSDLRPVRVSSSTPI